MPRSYTLPSLLLGGLAVVVALSGCDNRPQYPNCTDDSACHEGEFCVQGQCQQCRDNADCPRGEQCNAGRCDPIPGWCESNADCPPDEECRDNRCVPRPPPPETDPQPQACTLGAVYFAFDSSELSSQARGTLEENARCIQERDIPNVTVEGYCDPRGTEEYNLALGERRAQSVQGQLQRLGVGRDRIDTHSYGEERARGYDESTWAQDRRAETAER